MKFKCSVCGYEIETNMKHLVDECGWMFFFHWAICFVCKQKTWDQAFKEARRKNENLS